MKDPLSFDHRPDLVLGKALREALDPGDASVFIARVLAHAEPDRGRGLDRMMDELTEELRLDPGQRDSVRAIVQRHRTRMTAVWETVRPRFDSMRAQMDSEVALQLTPDQQAKYRDHVTRYRHQKDQEQTDSGSGGRKGRRK